jgi:type IV pilus assembly protein PilA
MLMVVIMIGLLAAMAIPAFQKVRSSSQAMACVNNQRQLTAALEQYHLEHGSGAKNWSDVVGEGSDKFIHLMPVCPAKGTYSAEPAENGAYLVTCTVTGHDAAAIAAARARRL